jgi:tetratricopeptide (TPR) repeat protein
LRAARAANRAHPDNLDTYAELACILRSLGRRAEAVETVQWMLNLRPTDPRGLWLAALLREDTGDLEGASDLMAECFQRTPAGLTAKRAEYLLGLARVFKKQGKRQEAEQLLREAQRLIPTQEKP